MGRPFMIAAPRQAEGIVAFNMWGLELEAINGLTTWIYCIYIHICTGNNMIQYVESSSLIVCLAIPTNVSDRCSQRQRELGAQYCGPLLPALLHSMDFAESLPEDKRGRWFPTTVFGIKIVNDWSWLAAIISSAQEADGTENDIRGLRRYRASPHTHS